MQVAYCFFLSSLPSPSSLLKFIFAGRGGNERMSPKPIQTLLPGAESYLTIIWKGFSAVFQVLFTSIVDVGVK